MKIKKLHLIAFLLCTANLAMAQTFAWAKTFGSTGNDNVNSISFDAAKNLYVVGSVGSATDFDPSVGVSILTAKNNDIFINKLDAAGNYLWSKLIGGTNNDGVTFSKSDNEGNLILTGYVYGAMNETTGEVTVGDALTHFICKIDASGNFIWIRTYTTAQDIGNLNISNFDIGPTGDIYLTGSFYGTQDLNPGTGILNFSSSGGTLVTDIYISKLDAAGNFIWAKTFGNEELERVYRIAVDAMENIYLTGNFVGKVDFDPGVGVTELSNDYYIAPMTGKTAFITKFDKNGNLSWAHSMYGKDTEGVELAVDKSGNVYASGIFQEKIDVNPGEAVDVRTVKKTGYYLCKLNTNGLFEWAHIYAMQIPRMQIDLNGDLYLAGSFYMNIGAFPGEVAVSLSAHGGYDIYVMKLKANGDRIWDARVGGRLEDYISAINIATNGDIYLTGVYRGEPILNPAVDKYDYQHPDVIRSIKHRSEFTKDVYVAKWTQVGVASDRTIKSTVGNDLYPNPTNGMLYLTEKVDRSSSLEVFNAQGQHIITHHKGVDAIDLTNFNSGIYFVRYTNADNRSVITKIVKQ